MQPLVLFARMLDRRTAIIGGSVAAALAASSLAMARIIGARELSGDMTDELERAPAGAQVVVPAGTWGVSRNIAIRALVRFDGGVLQPGPGVAVSFENDVEAAPGAPIFDLEHVRWRRLDKQRSVRRSSFVWDTDSGIRLPGIAYATWFGAQPGSDEDSTLALQAMLDSGAREAVLDGFFTHSANWVNDGQTLRGLGPHGAGRLYGLKTRSEKRSFADVWQNAAPLAPEEDAFRGLSTRSGIGSATFADFEYDGSARDHFDHAEQYRSLNVDLEDSAPAGTGRRRSFQRNLLRQGGISIASDTEDEPQAHRPPGQTTIERVYIHNVVRNCIVANRAPKVTIRDCRLADSDTDHLIYADRNPDLLVERTTFSGYARGGLVVISCGTLRDCVVTDLRPNPIAGQDTQHIVNIRNDLPYPSTIAGLRISADLGTLSKGDGGTALFMFAGRRNVRIEDLSVEHLGDDSASFAVFGANSNASNIDVAGLQLTDMPPNATLWNTASRISRLSMDDIHWGYRSSSDVEAPYLFRFGQIANATVSSLSVRGRRIGSLVSSDTPGRGVTFGTIDADRGVGRILGSDR